MKDIVEQALVSLPDDATIEDILEATFINLKIRKRLENVNNFEECEGWVGFDNTKYISHTELVDQIIHWCSYKRML